MDSLQLAHELSSGPLKVAVLNGANRKLCGNHWFQSWSLKEASYNTLHYNKYNVKQHNMKYNLIKNIISYIIIYYNGRAGGARFAIDENLHRRSASLSRASLLLNFDTEPRLRDLALLGSGLRPRSPAQLEETVRPKDMPKDPHIILYCIKSYYIFRYYNYIVLYCIVLYCIVLYCIVLYRIVLYCIVLYCIVFYFILFHFILLYFIVFYFILFHFILLYFILLYFVLSGSSVEPWWIWTSSRLSHPDQDLRRNVQRPLRQKQGLVASAVQAV